jgi:post-segregation antitoxin (ccd killing protein)
VDFGEYRRKNETRAVKKNCTVPGQFCYAAEKADIIFSQVLQEALKRELKISKQ